MPWFKVDDQLFFNAKTVIAGNSAMGLWVRAGSWASAQLTDGFIPTHMANAMANPMANPSDPDALVESGLWEEVEGGYLFHDWADFQPSAAVEKEKRKKRAEAGRLGAEARWGSKDDGKRHSKPHSKPHSEGHADDMANGKQTDAPSRPVPSSTTTEEAPPREDVEAICKRLADRIEGHGVKRPNITKGWRDDGRKLIDLDGYSVPDIERVIDWCQEDDFWKSNILSMNKLRKQFGALKIKTDAARPKITAFNPWDKENYAA